MTDKHRRRGRREPLRTATRRPRLQNPAPPPAADNPLLNTLRGALRSPEPTQFWVAAAPIVAILEEPGELGEGLPEGVDMLQTFIDVDVAETTALLHVVAALSCEDLLRARARRALTARAQPVPPHVTGLAGAQIGAARVFSDDFGDNHMVELTLPGEVRATLVLYVTRIPHLYLKDVFVMALPLEQAEEHFARSMAATGFVLEDALRELEPSQARAALEQALAGIRPDVAKDPEEGDQWPMVRPLVEFTLSLMPAGGQGYDDRGLLLGQEPGERLVGGGSEYAESTADDVPHGHDRRDDDGGVGGPGQMPWIDADGTDLSTHFLASPQAADLEESELTAPLVRSLMLLATDREGDPLFWDPDLTRWLLEEVLPVDPIIPSAAINLTPAVLPALVTWAHQVTEVDPGMTEAVHQAMTPLLTDLPARRSDPHTQVARLEAAVDLALDSEDPGLFHAARLAARVGGFETLHELDTVPLPTESLDLAPISPDLHEVVQEIDAQLVDGLDLLGEGVLGEEFLTACRRFLTQAASRDADVLRRRASSRTTAATIAWIVGRGNELVGYSPAPVRTGELFRAFEVRSTPSQRADSLMRAAVLPHALDDVALGSAELLVASAREKIITVRDLESMLG